MPGRGTRTDVVIFGASGDLTSRKIIPALHSLKVAGLLHSVQITGVARSKLTDETFGERLSEGVKEYSRLRPKALEEWPASAPDLRYLQGEYGDIETYRKLSKMLSPKDNRLFYLATPSEVFPTIVKNLKASGLSESDGAWRRIVIEKPFGTDKKSSKRLNREVLSVFKESQVYRIDHYLGKETVQNIVALRFANSIFEPLWNRNYIDHVQITMAEDIGVGKRAGYYERSGVLRDMVQNHILQLLALAAMEPPSTFEAQCLHDEKVKVLRAIKPVSPDEVVWGQYSGYHKEKGVARDSTTPTFVALRVGVDNWRWHGVPFYLRTGKMLARKVTQISLRFKQVPFMVFPDIKDVRPNSISLCIQPDEGVQLRFETMVPGMDVKLAPVDMTFHYDRFGSKSLPEAYERLLLDAIHGDQTLFVRGDFEERAWSIIQPILDPRGHPHRYAHGSWGPKEADRLLERDGRAWQMTCDGQPERT